MKKHALLCCICLVFYSCEKLTTGKQKNTPTANFGLLWQTVNDKYAFFGYKHINWDSVRSVYAPQVNDQMSDEALFSVMGAMLNELRDAHVNLVSPFNVSRYTPLFLNSPENYDARLVLEHYLTGNYAQTGPFKHQLIGPDSNIAYIYYGSFSSKIESQHLNYLVNKYAGAKGIILDVRNNGGGSIYNVFVLGSYLADSRQHIYTTYTKTGPGNNDFSQGNAVYMEPSGKIFPGKIALLTNRNSYSATSFFTAAMKPYPRVIHIGDTTGGGGGAPTEGELFNGWVYRFSATRSMLPNGVIFESGLPPDIPIWLDPAQAAAGKDNIIERALLELQ